MGLNRLSAFFRNCLWLQTEFGNFGYAVMQISWQHLPYYKKKTTRKMGAVIFESWMENETLVKIVTWYNFLNKNPMDFVACGNCFGILLRRRLTYTWIIGRSMVSRGFRTHRNPLRDNKSWKALLGLQRRSGSSKLSSTSGARCFSSSECIFIYARMYSNGPEHAGHKSMDRRRHSFSE